MTAKKKEEEKEDEVIEIAKLQRQVHIIKPEIQIVLSTECISEDMNYLTTEAIRLMEKYRN